MAKQDKRTNNDLQKTTQKAKDQNDKQYNTKNTETNNLKKST
jgi:hypothetical protein